ncbi:MAG: hypothetical protein E3J25_05295, partial [Anaerolineales bacterium]
TEPVFTVNDLWRYDTVTGGWEHRAPWRSREHGAGYDAGADYPGSRYCANLFAHGGSLYLFSGRDTGEKNPEFFNDLWRYDPAADCWTLLHPDDRDADFMMGRPTRPPAMAVGMLCSGIASTCSGGTAGSRQAWSATTSGATTCSRAVGNGFTPTMAAPTMARASAIPLCAASQCSKRWKTR